ncbi:hypothetical protein AGMMS49992_12530 [Clostridia bacterium]|nr:hypothetical protein AGMMS49992_12530 [Clostridia bacterium]
MWGEGKNAMRYYWQRANCMRAARKHTHIGRRFLTAQRTYAMMHLPMGGSGTKAGGN